MFRVKVLPERARGNTLNGYRNVGTCLHRKNQRGRLTYGRDWIGWDGSGRDLSGNDEPRNLKLLKTP